MFPLTSKITIPVLKNWAANTKFATEASYSLLVLSPTKEIPKMIAYLNSMLKPMMTKATDWPMINEFLLSAK